MIKISCTLLLAVSLVTAGCKSDKAGKTESTEKPQTRTGPPRKPETRTGPPRKPETRTGPPRKPEARTADGWPEVHRMDNGLMVFVLPSQAGDKVSVLLGFGFGSGSDPKGLPGMTHLMEHLLLRAKTRSTGQSTLTDLTRFVTAMNGETMHNMSYVYAVAPKNLLDRLLMVMALRWQDLSFDGTAISMGLVNIRRERKHVGKSAAGRLLNGVLKEAYRASEPVRWGKIALLEVPGPLAPADAEQFFRKNYLAGRAVLILAGDIEPDKALALAQKRFVSVPARKPPPPDFPKYIAPKGSSSKVFVNAPDMKGWQAMVVWPSPPWGSEDDAALTLAGMILQQKLHRKLVAAKLAQTTGVHNDLMAGPGHLFTVHLANRTGTVPYKKALAALWQAVGALGKERVQVPPKLLAASFRRNLYFSVRLPPRKTGGAPWQSSVQSSINLARAIFSLGNNPDTLVKRMEGLAPDKIREVAKKYLTHEKAVVGIASPSPK